MPTTGLVRSRSTLQMPRILPTWHLYTPGIFKYSRARNTYIMLQAGFDEVSHDMCGELGVSRDGIH